MTILLNTYYNTPTCTSPKPNLITTSACPVYRSVPGTGVRLRYCSSVAVRWSVEDTGADGWSSGRELQ